MITLAPNDLLHFLLRHQLLPEGQEETLLREADQFPSSEELTDELVRRGLLTAYQQSHLLASQGERLIFGPYRILDQLGEGGMGLVLKAWHPRLDRLVALKIIRPQILAARPDILTRFHREARAIAQLHHPNVVMLYDADEFNGTHFIAMEFVEGMTLERMVRQNGPLAYKQACDYIRQAALGLQHAMDCGLVHRDIKPSNILVSTKTGAGKRSSRSLKRPSLVTLRDREMVLEQGNGRIEYAWGMVKILDMGLARLQQPFEDEQPSQGAITPLTRAGALLGTPDFISPEQARDPRAVDIRSDLYALGCTFYYILTGRPPFPGGTDVQKLLRHQNEDPFPLEELRPHIPVGVGYIIRQLMAKDPADRPQTPHDVAEQIASLLNIAAARTTPPNGTPIASVPVSPTDPPPADTPVPMAEVSHDDPRSEEELSVAEVEPTGQFTRLISSAPSVSVIEPRVILSSAHAGIVASIDITSDGHRVVSGGIDGRVRIWETQGDQIRELAYLPRPNGEIQAVRFAPDSPYVVVGGTQHNSAKVWRWDWNEGRVFEWGVFTDERGGVGAMAFSNDGQMFSAGIGTLVAVWKINNRNAFSRTTLKGHVNSVRALCFSPDRRLLASGGEGTNLRLWGFGWLGTSIKANLNGHADIITTLTFSPDGKCLASAGLDRQVILWDPLTPSVETSITLIGHCNNIRMVRFLDRGQHLMSIGENGQIIVWDVASHARIREYQLQTSMMCSLSITPEGNRIVTGSTDGRIAIYDLPRSEPPSSHRTMLD